MEDPEVAAVVNKPDVPVALVAVVCPVPPLLIGNVPDKLLRDNPLIVELKLEIELDSAVSAELTVVAKLFNSD